MRLPTFMNKILSRTGVYGCKFMGIREEILGIRKEINFLPQGNKFLCGRKNIFIREEINLYTGRNKFIIGQQ